MNCREKILSEDYMSILLDYVPEEANQEDEAFCYQQVDGTLGIYYLDRSAVLPLSPVNYLYRYLPQLFCLGAFPAAGSRTFRPEPLEGSGILAQQRPPLELTGRRVVMAFIDTGISYENPVFRYSDGSSRILAIWDQTDQSGQSPEGFLYGTEYVREQIDRALELEDPHSLVPEKDEIGHGTAVASVAAGSRLEEGSLFTGAAPDCEIVAVKLRPAKQYLRNFYLYPPDAEVFQENDVMMAIAYAISWAKKLEMPLSICLGIGSSQGAHLGTNALSQYVDYVANFSQVSVSAAAGNEGNTRNHSTGIFSQGREQIVTELRVAEREQGFTMEFWGEPPEIYNLSLQSPTYWFKDSGTVLCFCRNEGVCELYPDRAPDRIFAGIYPIFSSRLRNLEDFYPGKEQTERTVPYVASGRRIDIPGYLFSGTIALYNRDSSGGRQKQHHDNRLPAP